MEVKSLCQRIRWARIGRLSTKNALVVEEPSGSEGEVGEEAVHTEGEVLFQLRIGILDIFTFVFKSRSIVNFVTWPLSQLSFIHSFLNVKQ